MRKLIGLVRVFIVSAMVVSVPFGIWMDVFPFWKIELTGAFSLFIINAVFD